MSGTVKKQTRLRAAPQRWTIRIMYGLFGKNRCAACERHLAWIIILYDGNRFMRR
jgi:hypothetical protein